MDWSRTGSYLDLLLWVVQTGIVFAGGALICSRAFRLRCREIIFAGPAAGLLLFIVFAAIFAKLLPLPIAYWSAAGLILGLGISSDPKAFLSLHFPQDILRQWPLVASLATLFLLFLRINRGLAIFDDNLHLPLVSLVAAGNIPPQFHLNPALVLDYHYGLHLLAGSLVSIGGFYSWTAIDVYKALSITLAAGLGILWYRRFMRIGPAIWVGGLFVLFAGGARWLSLLMPVSWIEGLSTGVELIGSAQQADSNLAGALTQAWHVAGEGPIPFMFAFISGIARPLTLAMGGSAALPAMTLFLLLLLSKRGWRSFPGIVFGLLLGALALISDHLFLLIWGGIAAAAGLKMLRERSWRAGRGWGWTLLPGLMLVPLTGGALDQLITRLALSGTGSLGTSSVSLPGLALRLPPAIQSSHLGVLQLHIPGQLILALIEIGPLLLLAVPVTLALPKFLRRGRVFQAGLALMAIVSFCAPLFIRFVERERDIARLTGAALTIWSALGLPFAWHIYRSSRLAVRGLLAAGFIGVIFGGLALFPAQLIAALQPQASYYLSESDAWMSRRYWDQLELDAWVLDPAHPYRPAAVFARTSGPAYINLYEPLAEFETLISNLSPERAASAGYRYIYLDRSTWEQFSIEQRRAFQQDCVTLLSEYRAAPGDYRRLYEIYSCTAGP